MKDAASLLAYPADRGARKISQRSFDEAARAARGLDRAGTESLHDFRVALRRVRTQLAAYHSLLGRAASKKIRRRLHALGHATDGSRDAQAALEWLTSHRFPRSTRPAARWLKKTWEAQTEIRPSDRRDLQKELRAVQRKFHHRLKPPSTSNGASSLRSAVREAWARYRGRFERELSLVTSFQDQELIHRARIEAKKARYVLEPMAAGVRGGNKYERQLRTWQTLLGDLHDLHLIEARVNRRLADGMDADPGLSTALVRGLRLIEGAARRQEKALFRRLVRRRRSVSSWKSPV